MYLCWIVDKSCVCKKLCYFLSALLLITSGNLVFFFNYGDLGWRKGGEGKECALEDVGEL